MLKIVNVLLGLSILVQFLTVVAMVLFHNYSFGSIHTLNGFILFVLIFLHLILNFAWIKKNILGRK